MAGDDDERRPRVPIPQCSGDSRTAGVFEQQVVEDDVRLTIEAERQRVGQRPDIGQHREVGVPFHEGTQACPHDREAVGQQ
jgi:hypothetical protein